MRIYHEGTKSFKIMNRGNTEKVIKDACIIAKRLRHTDTTLEKLMKEYHCGYETMMRAVRLHIPQVEWLSIRKKKMGLGGVKSRFKKGHIPWCKGIKGLHPSPSTEFKKGHIPACYKKLYTITLRRRKNRKDSRYYIATPGPTPCKHIWVPYAKYHWQKKYGLMPDGSFVVHKNGDSLDDRLSNLLLVDRRGNMALMKENNPQLRKKTSVRMRKFWKLKRKQKLEELKEAREQEDKLALESEMERLLGPEMTFFECCGCSYEFTNAPDRCPKCNGLRFIKVTQRRKTNSLNKEIPESECLIGV